jgi:hypothetical protein
MSYFENIPTVTDAGTKAEKKVELKFALQHIITTQKGKGITNAFKAGASVTGHKVGDNMKWYEAAVAAFGEQYPILNTSEFTLYEKSQMFNDILKAWVVVDKHTGKMTDMPGPKMVAHLLAMKAKEDTATEAATASAE